MIKNDTKMAIKSQSMKMWYFLANLLAVKINKQQIINNTIIIKN